MRRQTRINLNALRNELLTPLFFEFVLLLTFPKAAAISAVNEDFFNSISPFVGAFISSRENYPPKVSFYFIFLYLVFSNSNAYHLNSFE